MTTIPALISRARLELGDQGRPFQSQAVGDGSNALITIPFKPVDSTTVSVVLNTAGGGAQVLTSPTNYTLDDRNGLLRLASPLGDGALLTVTGTAFRYFNDADWTTFVTTALTQHLHGTYTDMSNLPLVEEYPVAVLAVCEALWALLTDSAFDIDISTPEGVSIPRHQRYEQLMQMLGQRQAQYNGIAANLNVGLGRIEMFTLRRVSKTTNHLVPVYVPQEYQDSRPMDQVFVRIDGLDTNGELEPVPVTPIRDLLAYSQQDFVATFTVDPTFAPFTLDLTNYTVKASVRKYPQALQPLAVFTVVVANPTTGVVQLSMDRSLTYFVGLAKFWDLQLIENTTKNVYTVMQGRFEAIRQGGQ